MCLSNVTKKYRFPMPLFGVGYSVVENWEEHYQPLVHSYTYYPKKWYKSAGKNRCKGYEPAFHIWKRKEDAIDCAIYHEQGFGVFFNIRVVKVWYIGVVAEGEQPVDLNEHGLFAKPIVVARWRRIIKEIPIQ